MRFVTCSIAKCQGLLKSHPPGKFDSSRRKPPLPKRNEISFLTLHAANQLVPFFLSMDSRITPHPSRNASCVATSAVDQKRNQELALPLAGRPFNMSSHACCLLIGSGMTAVGMKLLTPSSAIYALRYSHPTQHQLADYKHTQQGRNSFKFLDTPQRLP